jgi:hypothetical protein
MTDFFVLLMLSFKVKDMQHSWYQDGNADFQVFTAVSFQIQIQECDSM